MERNKKNLSDVQPQQPYSVKLESTSKGVRINVHIYGPEGLSEENRKKAITEAVLTFDGTIAELANKGLKAEIAPEVAK